MARFEHLSSIGRFSAFDTVAFFAFCISVPLFLPVLELWQGMTVSTANAAESLLPVVPFASALSLSAMFTALTFLFICLLKTAHARVSHTIMKLALVCYALGYGMLDLWSIGVFDGSLIEAICGLMLGFGAAVMCLVWVSRLHVVEFRSALFVVWLAGAACLAVRSSCRCSGPTLREWC